MKETRFQNEILPLKDKLFRLALRITLNREEAEDVVQDTLLRMWDRRENWDEMQSTEAMAMMICRNRALDVAGKAGHGNVTLDTERDTPLTEKLPDRELETKDRVDVVNKIISRLPEVQRSIVTLREVEGKTYEEIAQTLSLETTQVKVYLHRARQKIKTEFEKIENYGLHLH